MSRDPKDEYAFEFEKLAAPISQKIFDSTLEDSSPAFTKDNLTKDAPLPFTPALSGVVVGWRGRF